jgi:hypothetical protein
MEQKAEMPETESPSEDIIEHDALHELNDFELVCGPRQVAVVAALEEIRSNCGESNEAKPG